ncbi:hypothetical protein WN943_020786 [Citrus x changshan-huyou]|nr:hypothetical protein CUMW_024500 [Citrus unshiu]
MGFKRPFDDEEFQELPYKHSRQLDINNKMIRFSEFGPCDAASQKHDTSGEDGSGFYEHQWHEASENGTVANELTNLVDKDFETSAPLSWVTSSSCEEDAGSGSTTHAPLSLEHIEYDYPRRTFVPFEDSYSSLLDRSPRKQVPLGPNHQAILPSWDRSMGKNILDGKATLRGNNSLDHLGSHNVADNDNEEKWMGTCIIPMPDSNSFAHNIDQVGRGIMDCDCLDEGSIRCVQQHVMEAREKLLKSLGHEKFVKLGLCDMGEEVSCKWSEEEEQVFHEVVYSNPFSLGRNFWKQLSAVFPSRTKKEIVSYYFNVFVLRRRAVQNRSDLLEIDSDDDEWHGGYGGSDEIRISEEDEDSAIESPVDQENADCGEDSSDEDDDDGGDSDGDVGDGGGEVTGETCGTDHVSDTNIAKSFDEGGFDAVVPHMDKIPGDAGDDFNVEDESCTSFEFQPDMSDSCGAIDAAHALQLSGVRTEHGKALHGRLDGYNDLVGHMNLLDSCDAKVWDARYLSPIKGVELLPTCNIIEEIFGQGTWDTKTRND